MTGTWAPPDVRVFRKLQVDVVTGCWNWTGSLNTNGRGQIMTATGLRLVYVVSYERLVGPIPKGLELDHLCRNPLCANPAHLEPVTHLENMRRGRRAQQTHCRAGHLLSGDNVRLRRYERQGGSTDNRICLTCYRKYHAAYRAAKRKAHAQ